MQKEHSQKEQSPEAKSGKAPSPDMGGPTKLEQVDESQIKLDDEVQIKESEDEYAQDYEKTSEQKIK